MTQFEAVLNLVEASACLVVLLGLLAKGGHRLCRSLAAYLALVCAYDVLVVAARSQFFTFDAWLFKEIAQSVVKLAIVFELTARIFRVFPGARRVARHGIALIVVASGLLALQQSTDDSASLATRELAVVLYGTAALFAWLLVVVLWYRIPLEPLHKAVLMGYAPYLVVFTGVVHGLELLGWGSRTLLSYTNIAAYVALLGWWAVVAWRHESRESIGATLEAWAAEGARGRP